MKMFVAIEWSKPNRWKYIFNIYQVFEWRLSYVWQSTINDWMIRWPEGEVMNRLANEWYIGWNYTWYYDEHKNKNFNIQYIIPRF